jgi:type II secretory pathway pseudopilin PulG
MPVRLRQRLREEGGYTMIAVIGAISLVSMLAAATLAATNGDLNLVQRDVDYKRAHAAAQAGIADYSFHLNNDNSYWARCTNVPEPNAVNQVGSTARRRTVPGSTDAEYAIELLPATGKEKCDTTKPVESMLEQSGPNTGSFRIRSTGYAGKAKVSAVATYKRASFLDYVYFTQLETLDPVTYWTQPMIEGAYTQCTKFYREGRANQNIPGTSQPCLEINFASGDEIKGPLHTNDELLICGTPKFGRSAADTIEVGAPPQGWRANPNPICGEDKPTFVGPFVTTAPVLKPPATNGRLKKIAGPSYTFSCQTKIQLEGANMKVTTNAGVSTLSFPSSGVVYVQGGSCPDKEGVLWPSCSSEYSPRTVTYPAGSDCGTALVSGNYSGELTIAAENNIIIEGSITHTSGTQGLLGLIANNFVRVKHPFCRTASGASEGCPSGQIPAETAPNSKGEPECHGGSNAAGSLTNPTIEAAILAIEHSFILDHYDCGSQLGTLNVKGAISQKFRGTVGLVGTSGYLKNYEYDDRLRYMEPPNFLDPVEPAWHIQRETLDFG